MYRSSIGGSDAALSVYRHALVRLMTPMLAPLSIGAGWSPLALGLCSVLMSWDPAPTLAQRFESALGVLDRALPRRRRTGRTYQGFIKALSAAGLGPLTSLAWHLRALTRQTAGPHWRMGRFVPIGVDGSKFDAPRTMSNEALGLAGRDKCGPQMIMLLLVHLGSMLPWGWRVSHARDSERSMLRESVWTLPEGTLLVADAGFTGFELLSMLIERGVHVLVRVGRGATLWTELGYVRHEGSRTVYLWPNNHRDRPPLALRLIRVGSVHLLTSVRDPKELSHAMASELYRRRWGLEVSFRSLKQTLEHRKVRSGTASHAWMELSWSIVGLWVLALMGVRAITTARHHPRRLSIAGTLTAARWALHRPESDRRLRSRLRRAVLDCSRRTTSRKAWRWPHKKNPPPPGVPRLRTASAAQVARAQRLRARLMAA